MNVRSVTLLGAPGHRPCGRERADSVESVSGQRAAAGPPSPQPVALSLKDAVTRGAAVQPRAAAAGSRAAHRRAGARWRALEDLLPNVSGTLSEQRR